MSDHLATYPPLDNPAGREFAEAIRVFRAAAMKFDPTILSVQIGWEEPSDEETGCFTRWAGLYPNRSQKLHAAQIAAAATGVQSPAVPS